MVLYDGEKLIVNVNKLNYKHLLKIAEIDEKSEYLPSANCFVFSPTKHIARLIYEVNKNFTDEAKIFLQ